MDPEINNKKSQAVWLFIFTLLPAGVAIVAFAGKLPGVAGGWTNGALAALAGIAAGLAAYFPARHRALWIKGAALAGLLGVMLTGASLLPGRSGPQPEMAPLTAAGEPELADSLRTCLVCGYRAIPSDTLLCPVCAVELTEAERVNWEYGSLDEMLREEQAMFFAAEGFRDSVAFYDPAVWESEGVRYRKDTAWRPVIDKRRVLLMRDTLIRAGVIEAPAEQ